MSAIVSGNAAISLVKTSVCLLLPILVSCENKSERDHGEVSVTRQDSFKEKALLSRETSLQNDSLPSVKNLHKSGLIYQ